MNLKTDFTGPECDRFRAQCNFTPEELRVFNLRVKACSILEIQQKLHISESTVNRRIHNIKRKIDKVLEKKPGA